MKKLRNKEFVIGICVIAAIAVLVIGIEYLKGINIFNPANFYYVYYDNVNGLERSAPVTIDGFKVGQVRDVVFDYEHPGKIKVLLAVDKKLHIPEDSEASLASTLMSGAYVNITMGKSKKYLPVGSDIKGIESKDLFDSLGKDVVPTVTATLATVDTLVNNLNEIVADPALIQSVQRLDGITENFYGVSKGLNNLAVGLNRTVPGIMGNTYGITTKIDSVAINLMVLSEQLKQLPLNSTIDNVNQLTDNLVKFSNQLNDKNSTLGLLTSDPELYNRLNKVSADIDSLIVDIKKNPKRYISIKLL